jgi:hypothetical protein
LSAQAKKLGWRTVWISRGSPDETRDFCNASGIPLEETLVNPPYATYLRLGLAAVPQVVAVGDNGKVDEVWLGRLTPESAKAAAKFLSDHPGMLAIFKLWSNSNFTQRRNNRCKTSQKP